MFVIQGVRSQFHAEFTNSGVQCTAIAAASCCKASVKVLTEWNADDIDDCLQVIERLCFESSCFEILSHSTEKLIE